MVTNITHHLTPDGLTLTSEAVIYGELVRITTQWNTEEAAEDRYHDAIRAAEQQFQRIEQETDPATIAKRTSTVRNLFKTVNHTVAVGRMSGQTYDEAQLSIGRLAFTADINPATGRINLRTLRRKAAHADDRNLYGIGGRTWAIYLAVNPTVETTPSKTIPDTLPATETSE